MTKKYVVWFKEVDKDDIGLVGGKGANLGEMTKAGFPVPPGFIVTAQAYTYFLEKEKLQHKIVGLLSGLNVNDSQKLERTASQIQALILRSRFPQEIAEEIIAAYFQLEKAVLKHPLVAVRSSATAEDLPSASFAGQQSTFLNIRGEANLIEKIKEAWASLFTARAIFYRQTHHFDHFKVKIAVPVQKMVQADTSGILFTVDPVTNNKQHLVIEAVYGLGETVVGGMVTPDHYIVDKKTDTIVDKQVRYQEKMLRRKDSKNVLIKLDKKHGSRQKLTDAQILLLAKIGEKLERHYYFPQDAEWAIEAGQIYLVQTRPVTTLRPTKQDLGQARVYPERALLVKGDPASPGMASGPIKILKSARELHKIQAGDVLVAAQTNPDFVPAMRRASAIITERGGRTSHASIVSRELGIPAVVGVTHALTKLKDNLVVTVNGTTGEIMKGALENSKFKVQSAKLTAAKNLKTATKVYVNLAEPGRAAAVAKMNTDGVGLLRAEFMIAEIGVHPKKLIDERKQKLFVDTLSTQIEAFCSAFNPRPVVYRTTDFKTNEYRNLKGGRAYEPEEPNPMLGFRGAARYVADPRVFELELEAIKTVRNKMGYKNLWLMLPFVRTPKELLEVKKIIAGSGLSRSPTFKLWLMVEIPTNVIRLDDFLDIGIDGVSIGSNDLTMLMLGVDRDNSDVAHDFSEMDATLLWAYEHVIKTCQKRGVTSSICGQAPSDYPELVDKLVGWGITSISVNPDAVASVRETVSLAEERLVKNKSK
ncbi:MAG: phosphoenolpyruvate synthase [Patescibacteria group bacterium]